MITLLLLGFALSLDSFRVSLGLGALKLRPVRQVQIVLAFGLCDALAPLIGLMIGQTVISFVGVWTEFLGPLVLCVYGVYVIYVSRRQAVEEAPEDVRWIILGLPLTLSLDNLIAGASLGMIDFPILISVIVIGAISSLMALAGLWLGKTAVRFLNLKTELIGGLILVLIALVLVFEKFYEI